MSQRHASAAVMDVRTAVARAVADVPGGSVVLVGCSGGPDSLALAGATAWVGERRGLVVRAVVVDHGLQDGSAETAADAARACIALGLPSDVVCVVVGTAGGPEAAARDARYAALQSAAERAGAAAVLLGHTRDDQAETVLLRLARGSGARSLAAMSARSGLWRRPFLDLPRSTVHAAASDLLLPLGQSPWSDPHNQDDAYARVRVRRLLGGLGAELGTGVVLGLARSADLLRDDADALDAYAEEAFAAHVTLTADGAEARCDELSALHAAVRTRVIRRAALSVGCAPDALGVDHVRRIEALVVDWHGQGGVALPGGVIAERVCGRLCLHPS